MAEDGGMVDISAKDITVRTAQATGKIVLGGAAFEVVRAGTCAKGNVLAAAKVAALQAAKSTSALIPMCHPIMIESLDIDLAEDKRGQSITVTATAKSSGKTGWKWSPDSSQCGLFDDLRHAQIRRQGHDHR
ncbi:MAG: hypothetical protein JSW47_06760 [Phycisphaerales bacterium]|nr:MAG: hypothetical protein JSW47_06760 [Phycisphaerales bacterium]